MNIPFNKPYMTGKELQYINEAHANHQLAGDGPFTAKCNAWLEEKIGCKKALLTHSCTAALEMAAILAGIGQGDEVIMPSYTFVSTANAFLLRGAIPVFVDIRPDTMNIDEAKIEEAITPKTKAIVAVHYSGVGCDMDTIMGIAEKHGILVIEDAAQGIVASYTGRPLGSIGHLGAVSFHETKNITSGEGGALLINDARYIDRAAIIRDKGTNRSDFSRGLVKKYTWVDIGSSYLPGELVAAFLWAQMEEADTITGRRLEIWDNYHQSLKAIEENELIRRPVVPEDCDHNAHMYYILLPNMGKRDMFITSLKKIGIEAVFHYVPLHTSPMGIKYGRASAELINTEDLHARLVRLPMWLGLEDQLDHVVRNVISAAASGEPDSIGTKSRAAPYREASRSDIGVAGIDGAHLCAPPYGRSDR